MKNIFIAGLQRSGTNYAQHLINKNVDVNVFWIPYETNNGDYSLWKHNINPLTKELIDSNNIDGTILIIKNPYSWVESICFRNCMDIIDVYGDKYGLLQEGSEQKINIRNLIRFYKNFYINWLNTNAYLIKYEDLLSDKEYELNKFAIVFGVDINDNIEDVEPTPIVPYYSKDKVDKYLNVQLNYLSNDDIAIINQELGEIFFDIIRYEMKSPN